MRKNAPSQLNFLNVLGEYEIRREAQGFGMPPYTRWYWFYWIYRDGVRIIKFVKKETAVAYVRDRLGRKTGTANGSEQPIIQGATPGGWVDDGFGAREIPF